jgi:undecaprenyl-phosphate 4-deoxy-4-formamido-L-arabinose transferase
MTQSGTGASPLRGRQSSGPLRPIRVGRVASLWCPASLVRPPTPSANRVSTEANLSAGGRDAEVAVSIVVPCYRDEDNLEPLLERLGPVMSGLVGASELVLVDDGSPDRTGARAIELARDFAHPVTVVRLARNFGQHPAVFAGLGHARGSVVVTMDSDLQYAPEDIPLLIEALSPEYPVASGYREQRRDPWRRRIITRALSWWLARQTGAQLIDFGSMFRAYDRRVVEQMLLFTERHRYVPALVAWLGVPIVEIPITHAPRGAQGSRYRLTALVDMFLDLVTGYAVFPLRILTGLGLVASLLGFIGSLFFLIYRVVVGGGGAGTVSAFALVFFLLGTVLLIVAMLGEYVGRIYTEAKARPYYLVGEVVRSQPERAFGAGEGRNRAQ